MDDVTLDNQLLTHLVDYYGMDRFKQLYSIRYKEELRNGGKGNIPNRVLKQLVNMEAYYSPYKKDKSDGN